MLLCLAVLPVLFWDSPPETAGQLKEAGITQIAVPRGSESSWQSQKELAVRSADAQDAVKANKPGVEYRVNEASASRSPWIDANGWQILRQAKAKFYYDAPGPAAPLAAAEAFMYGADAMIHTDAAGLKPLAGMLSFLGKLKPLDLPPVANIGFVDDGTEEAGEVLNLMTRRNLLFRVVEKPDPKLPLNVQIGTPKYSKDDAADPYTFAQRLRSELSDEKRSLRIYGSEVVLGHLNGNSKQMRVHLLNYASASRPVRGIRVRVLGRYPKHEVNAFGLDGTSLADYVAAADATEFTLPELKSYAVVDLSQ
jgi:hypothetical protein